MKVEEKGRYAQTGGGDGDIWTEVLRLRTRSTGDDPPDGDRTERVGMRAGAGPGVDWNLTGVVSANPSRQSFPNTPRSDVRSVLLVVGFCNDGRCHVSCDTVTHNVTHPNGRALPPKLMIKRLRAYRWTHKLYTATNGTYIHTRGSAITSTYQTPHG